MADILGIGLTHYPSIIAPDEDRAFPLTRTLKTNDRIPPALKHPSSWPEPMQREYGDDQGLAAARRHRQRLVTGFRKLRAALDAFHPDFVLIWGDDQYENFQEDIIPPFCILCYDQMACTPFTNRDGSSRRNVWGEPADMVFTYRGQPQAARALAGGLLGACPRIMDGQKLTSQNAPELTIGHLRGVLLPPKMSILIFLGQPPSTTLLVHHIDPISHVYSGDGSA